MPRLYGEMEFAVRQQGCLKLKPFFSRWTMIFRIGLSDTKSFIDGKALYG